MKTLVQTAYGEPAQVLELRDEPDQQPDSDEVVIGVEAAVLQMADLHTVSGREGFRKSLPRTPGYEGVGRVLSVGHKVESLDVGDRVFCPLGSGTHREQITVDAQRLTHAPEGDAEQLALLALNPASALLMLQDYATLSEGDWIVQNAANSAIGRIIQQIATELRLRVINVVKSQEVAAELSEIGTSNILLDDNDLASRVRTTTQGAPIRLALDAVGGQATAVLASCLAEGGALVSHGAMSREACRVPPEVLTREVRVVGFNPARRLARCTAEERKQLFDRLATWMSAGRLRTKIAAVYPIDRAVEGYERIRKVGDKRFGKVVIRIQSLPPPEREEAKEEDSAAPEPLDMPPMDEAPAPAA